MKRNLFLKVFSKSGKLRHLYKIGPVTPYTCAKIADELEYYSEMLLHNKTGACFFDIWIDKKRKDSFEIVEGIL